MSLMRSGRIYGRESELAELRRAAFDGTRRVVWISGPPAVGKSRLAAELVLEGERASRAHALRVLLASLRDIVSEAALVTGLLSLLPRAASSDSDGSDGNAPLARFALALDAAAIDLLVLDDADGVLHVLAGVLPRLLGLASSLHVVVTTRALPTLEGCLTLKLTPLGESTATELARDVLGRRISADPSDDELAEITRVSDGLPGAIVEAAIVRAVKPANVRACATLERHLVGPWEKLGEPVRDLLRAASCFEGPIEHERLVCVASLGDGHDSAFEEAVRGGWLELSDLRGVCRMLCPVRRFVQPRAPSNFRRRFAAVVEAAARTTFSETSLEARGAALEAAARDAENLVAAIDAGGEEQPCVHALRALGELALARGIAAPAATKAIAFRIGSGTDSLASQRTLLLAELEMVRGEPGEARRRLEHTLVPEPELCVWRDALLGNACLLTGAIARGCALLEPLQGQPEVRGLVHDALGYAAHIRGQLEEAARLYARAEEELSSRGSWIRALRVRNRRAFLAMDQGRVEEAASILEDLLPRARVLKMSALEGVVLGYLGNVARQRRNFVDARQYYREAREVLRRTGETRFERTFAMDEASVELLCHRPRAAIVILGSLASDASVEALGRLPTLVGAYLLLGRSMLDESPSDAEVRLADPGEDAGLVDVHRLALAACALVSGQTPLAKLDATCARTLGKPSAHAVIARELVSRIELGTRPRTTDLAFTSGEPPRVWIAGKEATPTLSSKHRALLVALARARIETPGRAISVADLMSEGWPGERIARSAGENRLRVALSALRRLGLARVLERTKGGYRLSETARIGLFGVDLGESVPMRD